MRSPYSNDRRCNLYDDVETARSNAYVPANGKRHCRQQQRCTDRLGRQYFFAGETDSGTGATLFVGTIVRYFAVGDESLP